MKDGQLPFDPPAESVWPREEYRPYTGKSSETFETSKAAADQMAGRVGTLRRAVLGAIVAAGEHGMTDDELQDALELKGNTQRPRRIELWEHNFIVPATFKRSTPSGREAIVWIATHSGRAITES